MACSGVFHRIAAAAGCPAWHPEQFAGELSRGGLYVRPGKGRRRVPTLPDPASLTSLLLAIGIGEHGHVAERVRTVRNLVPYGGTDEHYPLPRNALRPPDAPMDWTVHPMGAWPIFDGKTLGDGLQNLIDRIARDAEPLLGTFREGDLQLRVVLAEQDGPYVMVRLSFPAESAWRPRPFAETFYVPAPDALAVPSPRGVRRDPVIQFPLIEESALIWRENLERSRIFADGQFPPVREDAAATLAGAAAANPEATPRRAPNAPRIHFMRESEKQDV